MGQLTSRENYYPIANPIAGLDSIVKSIIIAIAKNSLPDIISAAFVGTCRVCEQYLAYYLHITPYDYKAKDFEECAQRINNNNFKVLDFNDPDIQSFNITTILPIDFFNSTKRFLTLSFLYSFSIYQNYSLPRKFVDIGNRYNTKSEDAKTDGKDSKAEKQLSEEKMIDHARKDLLPYQFKDDYRDHKDIHSPFFDTFTTPLTASVDVNAPFFETPFDIDFLANLVHSTEKSLFNIYNQSKNSFSDPFKNFYPKTFLNKYVHLFLPGDKTPKYIQVYLHDYIHQSDDADLIVSAIPTFNEFFLERLTSINYINKLFSSGLFYALPSLVQYAKYPLLSYRLEIIPKINTLCAELSLDLEKIDAKSFDTIKKLTPYDKALKFSLNYQIYLLLPLMEVVFSYIIFSVISHTKFKSPILHKILKDFLAIASPSKQLFKKITIMDRGKSKPTITPANIVEKLYPKRSDYPFYVQLFKDTTSAFYDDCTLSISPYFFTDLSQAAFDSLGYTRLNTVLQEIFRK